MSIPNSRYANVTLLTPFTDSRVVYSVVLTGQLQTDGQTIRQHFRHVHPKFAQGKQLTSI